MSTQISRPLQIALTTSIFTCFLGVYLSISMLELGVGMSLLFGFWAIFQTDRFKFILNHPLFPSILSVGIAIILSILFAKPYPFQKPLEKVAYLMVFFPFAFFFYNFPNAQKKILYLSLGLSFILGTTATLQFLGCFKSVKLLSTHSMPIPGTEGKYFLGTGFTFHHTPFGASVTWIFHVLLAQLVIIKEKKQFPSLLAGMGFCLLAIACSFSRGVWLSLFCSTVFVLFLVNRRRATQFLLVFACTGGILFSTSLPFRERLSTLNISANQERLDLWKISIEMFKDSPIFGQGFHSFGDRLDQFSNRRLLDPHFPLDSHNMYLDFLSSTGLVGFGTFLFFLFSVGKSLVYRWRHTLDPSCKAWVFTCIGGFISFLIAGFFDRHFYMVQTLVPALFFLGMAISR